MIHVRRDLEDEAVTIFWTNKSVQPFANDGDPVNALINRANDVVLDAVESGWSGPPFDTFELANLLGIAVIPCESIRDARLIALPNDRYRIEYSPLQPQARIRFSIAHEIAHTFFPDCRESVRNRAAKHETEGDDWQLEMLCNVVASELLMPMGSFPEVGNAVFSIDSLLDLRARFQVSTEAILLRFLKLSRMPCAVFAASGQKGSSATLRIDYIRTANGWNLPFGSSWRLPSNSVANECASIGFTCKGHEVWDNGVGEMRVECVAIPSYPGSDRPRVVGLLAPVDSTAVNLPTIQYLNGDATSPRGDGNRIIAHVVNDATPRWGGGFARVVGQKWKDAQRDFISWSEQGKRPLRLGNHRQFQLDEALWVFHMVAQHGYRQLSRPGIRYHHLESCLESLRDLANDLTASVHMPRIGCGQAGGNWPIVAELIDDILCRNGIDVTVYTLPSERAQWEQPDRQRPLFGLADSD
ncbi:ImmA/IrrE family metallo-endopeptidase [Blastopirellula sp. J2-11]|uniref:ImmA/IrrE family metallo-endopeptidase n=1 Tax=Blastopirellula sp. J2-11 TaxID=2943192 RepID=UPI0021CA3142|nr:ImmA/IrrE family metallo-endopeptidase [Blastopirellula sp. J2-11]UUO07893.1 ImmA/IrrE family metallo-endopeptidase [Blastopirellula sp. J2-11]